MVAEFAKSGAYLNAVDNEGLTALMSAAHFGNMAATHELVARGARCSNTRPQGATALDLALAEGHSKVASALRKCSTRTKRVDL
jgi:ankyrin repeat protein